MDCRQTDRWSGGQADSQSGRQVSPGISGSSSTAWRTPPDPASRCHCPAAELKKHREKQPTEAHRGRSLCQQGRGKAVAMAAAAGAAGAPPAGQGYVHQVDHHPAALHAEAVRFDVTSCERKQEVRRGAPAQVWRRSRDSRLPTILLRMLWSSSAEISAS